MFIFKIIIHCLVWWLLIFIGVFILYFFNISNYFDLLTLDMNLEVHMDLSNIENNNNNNQDVNNINSNNNNNKSGNNNYNNNGNNNNNEKVVSLDVEDKEDDKYYNFSIKKIK